MSISEFYGEIMHLTDRWKLALNRQGTPYLQFDRDKDPDERTNLLSATPTSTTYIGTVERIS